MLIDHMGYKINEKPRDIFRRSSLARTLLKSLLTVTFLPRPSATANAGSDQAAIRHRPQ